MIREHNEVGRFDLQLTFYNYKPIERKGNVEVILITNKDHVKESDRGGFPFGVATTIDREVVNNPEIQGEALEVILGDLREDLKENNGVELTEEEIKGIFSTIREFLEGKNDTAFNNS